MSLAVGILANESAPTIGSFSTSIKSMEISDREAIGVILDHWVRSNAAANANCDLAEPAQDPPMKSVVSCSFRAANDEAWLSQVHYLISKLDAVRALEGYSISTGKEFAKTPLWALLAATVTMVLLSAILVRRTCLTTDILSAGRALKKYPWLLVLPIVVWLVVSNLSLGIAILLGVAPNIDQDEMEQAILGGVNSLLIPFAALQALLLAPLFEEALFRGWLYRKSSHIQPRWVVALLNAWYFSLMHLVLVVPAIVMGYAINPAQISPLSLPVWFALGWLLFWVRETYQSITLCVFLHSVYNAAMFAGFYWVQAALHA